MEKSATSAYKPDPSYHEKVELLLNTLRYLGENEIFFFFDEWGPIQVRKRGGKAYRNDHATIPRHQVSRGTVSLIAALSATTNQVTWRFLESKDSHAMMDTIEILYNQYQGVLSGMTRAVINNSDYPDATQMKQAISKHFSERNEHFRHNPRRVGKKIWEFDFFQQEIRELTRLKHHSHELKNQQLR